MQAQVQVNIQSIINPVYKHYGFYYTGSQINNSFNLFRNDWDAVLLERLLANKIIELAPHHGGKNAGIGAV